MRPTRTTFVILTVVLLIPAIISSFSDFPFWGIGLLILLAMMANAAIIVFEDNLPGGFDNPIEDPEELKEAWRLRRKRWLPARLLAWSIVGLSVAFLVWTLILNV